MVGTEKKQNNINKCDIEASSVRIKLNITGRDCQIFFIDYYDMVDIR